MKGFKKEVVSGNKFENFDSKHGFRDCWTQFSLSHGRKGEEYALFIIRDGIRELKNEVIKKIFRNLAKNLVGDS